MALFNSGNKRTDDMIDNLTDQLSVLRERVDNLSNSCKLLGEMCSALSASVKANLAYIKGVDQTLQSLIGEPNARGNGTTNPETH